MIKNLIILVALFSSNAYAIKDRGGGFKNYHTDAKTIRNVILSNRDELVALVQVTSDQMLKNSFSITVDRNHLISILKSVVISPTTYRTRITPDGYEDFLIMDYGVDANGAKYIEVLASFFDLYREKGMSSDEVKRYLFHESLHHLGITDEDLAWKNSEKWKSLQCDDEALRKVTRLENWAKNGATYNETLSFSGRAVLATNSDPGPIADPNGGTVSVNLSKPFSADTRVEIKGAGTQFLSPLSLTKGLGYSGPVLKETPNSKMYGIASLGFQDGCEATIEANTIEKQINKGKPRTVFRNYSTWLE